LTSGPATLRVNTLPEPAPEGFSGGVGAFSWVVSTDTNAITTDGALTLSVTLRGNGDARRFGKPKLDAGPAFEVFEPSVQEEETFESLDEVMFTRKMEYVLLPKYTGDHEFTPKLAYFHPDSNRYCTLTASPVRVAVSQGQNIRKVDMPEPAGEEPDVHSDSPLNASLLFAVLFAAFLAVTLILFYRKKKKGGPGIQ
ncbi:MAG: BatD family protein, partial [Bacteroidota bacterium]